MDIGSILLLLALVVFTAAFVLRPLRENRSVVVSEEEHLLSHLLAERDRLLNALVELDFDNDMGKVSEETYDLQRSSLMEKAAEVLKTLDEMQPQAGDEMDPLEAAIATRKAAQDGGDPLEAKIAAHKQAKDSKTAGGTKFCPECGKKIVPGDRFCASCGKALG